MYYIIPPKIAGCKCTNFILINKVFHNPKTS